MSNTMKEPAKGNSLKDQLLLTPEIPEEGITKNPLQSLRLQWNNLTYTLKKNNKKILKNVFGEARPGEITALIGQSGAGKTSLLNILAQIYSKKIGKVEGDISINNSKITTRFVTSVSSYLRQEDIYHTFFSPDELLTFAANLRLKGSDEQKKAEIDKLIRDLNLSKCRETQVGSFEKKGVSGGEKRRISLGLELLVNPPIIFLDEPTSGLDSFTALLVMGLLKKEAK